MSLLNQLPSELPFYGLKWSIFYKNINGRTIDLNIYQKDFTGISLCTEDEIDICTESGIVLTPGMAWYWQLAITEDGLNLMTEDNKYLAWELISQNKSSKEDGSWLPITYNDRDLTVSKSFSDGDFFKPIVGSGYTLSFFAFHQNEFKELREATERQYLFEYKVDGVIQGEGYILPETLQQDWGELPHLTSIQAVDGLGLLAEIPFEDNAGEPFTGIHKIKDVLTFVFHKAGLRGNWFDGIKYMPDDIWAGDRPYGFAYNTYVDVSIWEGMKCKEVLEEILTSVEAQVLQVKNDFVIRHPDNSDDFPAWMWNWRGDILPEQGYNVIPVSKFVLQDNGKFAGRGNLTIDKPRKSVSLIYRREAVGDMTKLWPDPEIVGTELVPHYYWEGGAYLPESIHGGKPTREIRLKPISGVTFGQFYETGGQFKWEFPDIPEELYSFVLRVKLTLRFSLNWKGREDGDPIPTGDGLEMNWQYGNQYISLYRDGIRVNETHDILLGYFDDNDIWQNGAWKVDRYSESEQKVEFYIIIRECNEMFIRIHPHNKIPTQTDPNKPWIQIGTSRIYHYEVRDELTPSTDMVYKEVIREENRSDLEMTRYLGNPYSLPIPYEHVYHLYSGMAYWFWKPVYMRLLNSGTFIGITTWRLRSGETGIILPEDLLARYKEYYKINRYRFSVNYINQSADPIHVLSIIQDKYLDQNLLIASYQHNPKFDTYSLELIGFELK